MSARSSRDRGVEVDCSQSSGGCNAPATGLIDAARPCRDAVGGGQLVDETYVHVAGTRRYVYRAVDQEPVTNQGRSRGDGGGRGRDARVPAVTDGTHGRYQNRPATTRSL